MTKDQVRRRILEVGIIPVVRASSGSQAIQAAEAVCAGGIPVVELTMTVPGALEVIAKLAKGMGKEVLVGSGTVLDADSARRCLDAGAQFLVSPGFDLATVQLANSAGVLIMAGALTPTEVIAAWKAGSDLVKVFPCGNVGGAKYIKALKAPLPQVPMVPTGGVNLETAADFLRAGSAALGIGGELISASALRLGNVKTITDAARQYVSIVKQTRQEITALPA
ncbi:MAG TPA: bifunctional 4-hydroxy-2-oxoglutarate aldolase/2-dehydro-3-deoxy-phosphogluconate aldolase [Terriglobales bacterium]|jgi:2-dehydro-3-deoxyphosphogluconate aldolase/(4S)-4-hydroxy-2-oxoglutarate aldolase|nr:bifunctional 4-hydroxy-2-oxoglutarate aldolase/2-dehydro-3-deoxy-phosphogluconate aldolase [Terriglobales bacterium]